MPLSARHCCFLPLTLACLALAASPASARRIVIDDGSFVTLTGCAASEVNCAPTLLPFDIRVGGELTRNIFLVGESGRATIYLGSLTGQSIEIENVNSNRGRYDREADFDTELVDDDTFLVSILFGADFRFVGQEGGGTVVFRNLSQGGSVGDFEIGVPFRTSTSIGSAYLPEATSRGPGGEFGSFIFQSAVPEPSTWATMLAGFGAIGCALRRRGRRRVVAASG